jgi:hypothetical protein
MLYFRYFRFCAFLRLYIFFHFFCHYPTFPIISIYFFNGIISFIDFLIISYFIKKSILTTNASAHAVVVGPLGDLFRVRVTVAVAFGAELVDQGPQQLAAFLQTNKRLG